VGFPAGTGLAHTFINDSEAEVRLLVVGERRPENRIIYPLHPQAWSYMEHFWEDAPEREVGPHNGRPERVRVRQEQG
jgi:uncharacterized cupin superfamily protein